MGDLIEHAVRFEIRPAPELKGPGRFLARTPRKATLIVANLRFKESGSEGVHTGLQLDVYLQASSLDDALTAATAIAEDFTAEMSVLAAARCGRPSRRIVVDVDANREFHPFRQYVPADFDISRRWLPPDGIQTFRSILRHFGEDDRKSVLRSVHAYSHAMASPDPLVEFLLLWVSLEALDHRLAVRFRLRKPKALEGTKTFFERFPSAGGSLYREAYDLRNRFVHGSRDLEGMAADAARIVGPIRVASRDAIAHATRSRWTGDRRPIKNWPVTSVIELTLKAPKQTPLGIGGDLPQFRIKGIMPLEHTRSGDQVSFATHFEVEERFGPGVDRGTTATARIEGEQVALNRIRFLPERGRDGPKELSPPI